MSATTQLKTITTKLSDYFAKLNLYLVNVSNPLPSFEDYNEDLIFDVILTDAIDGQQKNATFSNGALTDTSHICMAVAREFAMRTKGKIDYYQDAQIDSAKQSEQYVDMYARYTNYYRGSSVEQINS